MGQLQDLSCLPNMYLPGQKWSCHLTYLPTLFVGAVMNPMRVTTAYEMIGLIETHYCTGNDRKVL